MDRLEMRPWVVDERQLSKVHAPQGRGSGPGAFSAFSTASWWEMGPLGQEQSQRLPSQSQLHGRVMGFLQSDPGSTGTMLEMTISSSSSCSCCMQLSYTFFTWMHTRWFSPSSTLPFTMPGQASELAFL